MAAGKGKRLDDGQVVALDVKAGDRILFGKYSGNEITLDGTEYIIMREDDVLGVLDTWTKLHPELELEADVSRLLKVHETLAAHILEEPDVPETGLSPTVAAELDSLEQLRRENDNITIAYEALTIDHESVKRRLRERETRLRELVSAIPAAVCACDGNGFIIYCNQHAAELWGREPESDDRPWSSFNSRKLYPPTGFPLILSGPDPSVLATGLPVLNAELVFERADSTRIPVLANVAPLRDPSGLVYGAVNIFQDIAEVKAHASERSVSYRNWNALITNCPDSPTLSLMIYWSPSKVSGR